jgi:MoxR-like ATPase
MQLSLEEEIKKCTDKIQQLQSSLHQIVVGQHRMVERLLIGLFTGGHILLEGVPGLAKTLTISTLAELLQLKFQRIQFTPDLLPADLLGTLIYNQKEGRFEIRKGPIFAHLILADEVNRSPAKVQSALLEAMQEKQVTIGDTTFKLESPFLVLATQNPIDQEGTYPLPEAQIDRFMMRVFVSYPTREEELTIMRRMAHTAEKVRLFPVIKPEEIFQFRNLIDQIQIDERLENYIVDLVFATRIPEKYRLAHLKNYIRFGASPRASIAINLAAKGMAFLCGRTYVLPEDIKQICTDVLNHRLILSYEAEADNISSNYCIEQILKTIPI